MCRRGVDDRSGAVVWSNRPLERLRERRDLACLCDAADPADVEDDDLRAAADDQIAERRESVSVSPTARGECVARCTSASAAGLDTRTGSSIHAGSNSSSALTIRTLPAHPKRVQLHHDVDLRADRSPDLPERLERAIEVAGTDVVAEARLGVRIERPDLHPGDALGEEVGRELVRPVEERVEIFVRPFRVRGREPQFMTAWPLSSRMYR